MAFITWTSAFILAYLIGSIPTAVWISKRYFSMDVREHGSKNAGATNTFRVLGKKAGISVLVIDILKGFLASSLGLIWITLNWFKPAEYTIVVSILLGCAAVVGHLFSIFTSFKGGKGVATFFGVVLYTAPKAALVCCVLFFIILVVFKYVSLSSILASLFFLSLQFISFFNPHGITLVLFGTSIVLVILITHRKNIRRLLKGEENKIYLFKNN
jgi:glycerol-3-phosphate acyltransferase PlsY